MTSELTALAALMADIFRDRAVPLVIASQAGLDTALIPGSDTIADLWWNVIERAHAEGLLGQLMEVAKKRVGTRKGVLEQAYQKVMNAEPTSVAVAEGAHDVTETRKPRQAHGSYPPTMSDNWRYDVRIDALQKEVADLRAIVAKLETTLSYLVKQNDALNEQNRTILAVLEQQNRTERKTQAENKGNDEPLPHDLKWYLAIAAAIVITVLVVSYFGGNIP